MNAGSFSPTASLLEVKDLRVAYGGIQAVQSIAFDIYPGEMIALVGANGAGKTTTLKALTGLVKSSGMIHYQGLSIHGAPTHTLAARGIALVPEGRGVFSRLTVEENLNLGAYHRGHKDAKIRTDLQHMYELFPRLAERRAQTAGTLSGGEQQMLAIGRALMSKPQLLLLDEPSMGLAPLMVQKIFETIKAIAKDGVTILLVEQNARLALETAQRGYVMESGTITLHGAAQTLLNDARVRNAYLGENVGKATTS